MEKTKTLLENWADAQNQLFDNWMNQTQEFQKSMPEANAFEKSVDYYKEWLEKQRESFHKLTHPLNGSSTQAQNELGDKWEGYFNTWMEWQKKSVDTWKETGKRWMSAATNNATDNAGYYDQVKHFQNNWMNGYKAMMNAMKFPMENNFGDMSGKTMTDTYMNMQKGMDSYLKFYELWMPVFDAIRKGTYKPEEYKKILNPELYREMIDKMFGFDLINPMKDFYNRMAAFASSTYGDMQGGREAYEKWAKYTQSFAGLMPQGQHAFSSVYSDMYNQFRSAVSPFFKLMPEGKEKEQAELAGKLYDYYMQSASVLSQLQYQIYITGMKSMENLAEKIGDNSKEGNAYQNPTEFYNTWISTNGSVFEALFATDEYAKLQGELVTLDAKIKTATNQISEALLSPYPVVLRSQMDELYKANYDLRNRVYELEKQISNLAATNQTDGNQQATGTQVDEIMAEQNSEAKSAKPNPRKATK